VASPRLESASPLLRLGRGALVGLVVAGLLALARGTTLVEGLELKFLDARTRAFAGGRAPDPRIVLVEVTEDDVRRVQESLAEPWPWNLEINAHLFSLMDAAGVKAVVVDVLHFDRGAGRDDLAGDGDATEAELLRRENEAEQAEAYGEALQSLGHVALAFELCSASQYAVAARTEAAEGRWGGDLGPSPAGLVRGCANLPVRRVTEGASVLGFANFEPDADGVVRRAFASGRIGERPVLSLPLAAALAAGETVAFEPGGVRVGERVQPLMADGSFLVDFRHEGHGGYADVSPADVLGWAQRMGAGEEVPAEARAAFEGKIAVFGVNLSGAKDVLATPVGGTMHGADFHAQALDNLLHGGGRVRASPGANLLFLLAVAVGLGAVAGAVRRRFVPDLSAVLAAAVTVGVAAFLFARGVATDLFTPLAAVLFTWGGTTAVRLLTEGRRNRWLEGTFGRYLSPAIIEALKHDPSLISLGGRRREVTILFSDVAGFTSISEALKPEQLVELLNRYLTAHVNAVMAEDGVVDKFIGDAVMAFYGDPIPTDDHAVRACRTALAVVRGLPALEPLWRGMGLKAFYARFGLNTGDVVVGNMGSAQRFDYTVMGDAVNLASRLEGANKVFGSTILLGPKTYERARDHVVVKPLCDVKVVGRDEPAPLHELLALCEDAPPDLVAHAEAFARSQAAARSGDLPAARAALDEADRLKPGDGPVAWFGKVLDRLERGDDPTPWSGLVSLTGK
jgi:adenylate cyclase